eukprot:gene16052-biopygen6301
MISEYRTLGWGKKRPDIPRLPPHGAAGARGARGRLVAVVAEATGHGADTRGRGGRRPRGRLEISENPQILTIRPCLHGKSALGH